MKRYIFLLALLFIQVFLLPLANADEDWRVEFDYLCGKTEDTLNMKLEELNELVLRCDKLKIAVEASDNPQKKIFLKRLDMCRNLFIYTIEVKSQEKKPVSE